MSLLQGGLIEDYRETLLKFTSTHTTVMILRAYLSYKKMIEEDEMVKIEKQGCRRDVRKRFSV